METDAAAPAPGNPPPATSAGFVLKKACLSALVAFGLFALMIGVRTEAGGTTAQLIYWTRCFGRPRMASAARRAAKKPWGAQVRFFGRVEPSEVPPLMARTPRHPLELRPHFRR